MGWIPTSSKYDPNQRDWVQGANERIEAHRKAIISVQLRSKSTQEKNISIHIRQKSHAFGIGSAVSAKHLMDTAVVGGTYREVFLKYFNEAVLENDLKWPNWRKDKVKGAYSVGQTMSALQLLRKNKIYVRGHYLFWNPHRTIDTYSGAIDQRTFDHLPSFEKAVLDHAFEIVQATDAYISEWDAINHPVTRNQVNQITSDGRKLLLTDLFKPGFMEGFLDSLAGRYPEKTWYVNESQILTRSASKFSDYYDLCKSLVFKNTKLGGIGFMAHFGANNLPDINSIYEKLELFGSLGLPLKVTEFDVLFGDKNSQPALSKRDIELQRNFTADFIRLCFSHPSIESIVLWGFWEKRHWYPSAALWDKDWNIKPNGQAFIDLFYSEWFTRETGKLNEEGLFETSGFLGEYAIELRNDKNEMLHSGNYLLKKEGIRIIVD
jgi:endo-1,4-beta-xylanase